MKTLIAEDLKIWCNEIALEFEAHPLTTEIFRAYTGTEARETALQLNPDYVLLDIELPDISGIQIAQSLLRRQRSTKVLLMSVYFDQNTIFSVCDVNGLSGFISKAVTPKHQFPEIVYSATPGKPHFSPDFEAAFRKHSANVHNIRKILTRNERRLLGLIGAGLDDHSISDRLKIPTEAVIGRTKQLRKKLDAHTRSDLITIAQKTGCFRSAWFDLNLVDKYGLY